MQRRRTIEGRDYALEEPVWEPLLELVGEPITGDFMCMFGVQLEGGERLVAYKHIDTRRYIHLAADLRAFVYVDPGRYEEREPVEVLESVFLTLPELKARGGRQLEESDEAVRRAAERRQGRGRGW